MSPSTSSETVNDRDRQERVWVARAELVLARPDYLPVRELPLDPDPLTGVARAMSLAREDLDETVDVVVDLLPLTAGDRRRRRRAAVATDRRGDRSALSEALFGPSGVAGLGDLIWNGTGRRSSSSRRGRARPAGEGWLANQERLAERRATRDKMLGWESAFWLQLLIRARSTVEGRHVALMQAMIAAFEPFAGENYLRVHGRRFGPFFVGSDSLVHRRSFDRRWWSGLHRAVKAQMVTTPEIAGLLKPPTVRCAADNVARSGGLIPAPPRGLATYVEGRNDLLPLGWITTDEGERPVGVTLAENPVAYTAGRTGSGKTASAVARAAALFRAGHGGLFLDPHTDGVQALKRYIADRRSDVWEINLTDAHRERQAGWNLFSKQGLTPRDIEARVSAVVTSFAAVLGWREGSAPRALTLITMAAQALCELALRLPADLAPTIFQMVSLLDNDTWRNAVLPHLSPYTRGFFEGRFLRLDPSAATPVTNLIDRMRSSPTVAALLGSSRSTYDVRRAMDTGRVVLWATGTDAWATLVSCLVTHDLFRAAMSRRDLPPSRRRPFWCWLDELQQISGSRSGSAGESVARSLEEGRKMGLRFQLMSQQPSRLAAPTLEAILTNRAMLASHEIGADSAKLLAREWGDAVEPATITRLPRHRFVAQVTLDGQVSRPFLVRGFDPETEPPWTSWHHPEHIERLERRIDTDLRRRPVAETLAELDTLDDRIVDHLEAVKATAANDQGTDTPSPDPSTQPPDSIENDLPLETQQRRANGQARPLDNGHNPSSDHDANGPNPRHNAATARDVDSEEEAQP